MLLQRRSTTVTRALSKRAGAFMVASSWVTRLRSQHEASLGVYNLSGVPLSPLDVAASDYLLFPAKARRTACANLWQTNTDRSQVEAALVNLCVNARDAMPEGGRLIIETRNAALDEDYVALNPDATIGDHVMLSVTDTGSGMPPEILAKVFEPFFTTKGVGKGTGLGLSMVHGFIKQSKGNVSIYSEVGVGTAIKLYLPRSNEKMVRQEAESETRVPRGTERILVVEDDEAIRSIVAQQLASLGYAVVQAGTGLEGIILTIALTWSPAMELFRFGPLHLDDLSLSLLAAGAILVVLEITKPYCRAGFRS